METITSRTASVERAIALLAPLGPVVVARCSVEDCAVCCPGLDVAA